MTYIVSLTALCAAVILIRGIFRKRVPAMLSYVLWIAVVLRLFLPIDLIKIDVPQWMGTERLEAYVADGLNSVLGGAYAVLPQLGEEPTVEQGQSAKPPQSQTGAPSTPQQNAPGGSTGQVGDDSHGQSGNGVTQDRPEDSTHSQIGTNMGNVSVDVLPNTGVDSPQGGSEPDLDTDAIPPTSEVRSITLRGILGFIWAAGSAVTLSVFALSYLVFSIRLRRSREYFGLAGKTRVYVSDKVLSPCVTGLVPAIYLTAEASRSESLPVILLHEKVHMAHGDHIWNVLRVLAVSIHWWNPFVWAAAILSRRDAELACDESVVKALDSGDRIEYARMIVEMTPVKKNYAVGFGNGPIKERVINLTNIKKYSIIAAVLAVIIAIVIAAAAFIGAEKSAVNVGDGTEQTDTDTAETEPSETKEPAETEGAEGMKKDNLGYYREYGNFKVYDYEDYDQWKLDVLTTYDVSTSEDNFKFVLRAKYAVSDVVLTRLDWLNGEYVDTEKVIKTIGSMSTNQSVIICVDSVETIGYTGIRYKNDNGDTVRVYPITDDKDGSVNLLSYGDSLGPRFYLGGRAVYSLTIDGYDSLKSEIDRLMEDEMFAISRGKVLEINGLSEQVFVILDYFNIKTVWVKLNQVNTKFTGNGAELCGEGVNTRLYEHDGAVILSSDCGEIGDTWVITPQSVTEFHIKDGCSVTIKPDEDGSLRYTKFAVKFNGVQADTSVVLKTVTSSDDFLRETGTVTIDADGKVTLTPEKTYKISDVYDLDALYGEYRWTAEFIRKYPYCESADDLIEHNRELQELCDKAEKDNDKRYKWIAAFLSGDYETCVSMTNTYDQMYGDDEKKLAIEALMQSKLKANFDSISIGNYSVEEKTDRYEQKYLQFDFEIVSSESAEYPVGDYSVRLDSTGHFASMSVIFVKRPDLVHITDEYEKFFAERIFYSCVGHIPGKVNNLECISLFSLYERIYGEEGGGLVELTYAQMEEIAEKTLSERVNGEPLEISTWPLDPHTADDGSEYYTVRGMGGLVTYRDLINRTENDGVITYDVRYYNDVHQLLCAKVIRYTVVRTDTEYAYKLAGVETITDTGLDIFSHGT